MQVSLDPNDEESEVLTNEELRKRKYIRIAFFGIVILVIVGIIGVVLYNKSGSTKSEETSVSDKKGSEKEGVVSLIELSRIKNIDVQYYNAGVALIANTPEELMVNLQVPGWEIREVPLALGYSRTFTQPTTGKKVTTWLRVFSSNSIGREEMYDTLVSNKENPNVIVSENHAMGGGGFITNNGKEITYWFYYEPNIVAKASMLKSEGGSLQEVTEWAHRVNHSIYSVLD